MFKITLDTCCLDSNNLELAELKKLKDEGHIELWIELESEYEKQQLKNISKKLNDISWINRNVNKPPYAYEIPDGKNLDDVIGWTNDEFSEIIKKIREIHSPEFTKLANFKNLKINKKMNKWTDWKILAFHVLNKRDYFVTIDEKGFIKDGRKEKFESTFNIQIRKLDDKFISELKSLF